MSVGRTVRMGIAPKFRLVATLGMGLSLIVPLTAGAAEQAVVKLWNWNIHDKKFQQKMYKLFNERHPEIKIEYSSISNTVYDQTLEAAFVAKSPPDLFLPSGSLTFHKLRTQGLIKALNDIVPTPSELTDFMGKYPANLHKFVEGATLFNGKLYNVDLSGGEANSVGQGALGFPLYYNKTLFKESGIEKPPATFSEMRRTAGKITQTGQGKFYGAVVGLKGQLGLFRSVMWSLAFAAGVNGIGLDPSWGPDPRDGEYHFGSPQFADAMKVWTGMRADGSVFPGDSIMEDEQAKMAFATNKAALQFGGYWNVGNYLSYNPDCVFDLVLPPTPDDGIRRGLFWYSLNPVQGPQGYVVASLTKNPKAVWEVIKFISSLEYQEEWVKGGYGVSFLPEANKPENFTVPQMYRFVQWGNDPALRRIVPGQSEAVRKTLEMVPGIYPTVVDVLDNVYLGGSGFEALVDLDKRCAAALDVAIKKAQESGIKIEKKDFLLPDWDPLKDYLPTKK